MQFSVLANGTKDRRRDARRPIGQLLAACAALVSSAAAAGGLSDFQTFLESRSTGRLTFVQMKTGPFQGTPRRSVSEGSAEFARPDKFRLEYSPPNDLVIVADGTKVFVYDPPLQLTTVYNQTAIFSPLVASLLSAKSVEEVKSSFLITERSEADTEWVALTPQGDKNEYVRAISLGFKQGELVRIDLLTAGEERLRHDIRWAPDSNVDPARFKFEPPAGSDVQDSSGAGTSDKSQQKNSKPAAAQGSSEQTPPSR